MPTEPIILDANFVVTAVKGGNSGYDLFYASNNETVFKLHNGATFIPGSTFVYVNNSYQNFGSYTESADCTTITFNSSVANGASVEVRYIKTTSAAV